MVDHLRRWTGWQTPPFAIHLPLTHLKRITFYHILSDLVIKYMSSREQLPGRRSTVPCPWWAPTHYLALRRGAAEVLSLEGLRPQQVHSGTPDGPASQAPSLPCGASPASHTHRPQVVVVGCPPEPLQEGSQAGDSPSQGLGPMFPHREQGLRQLPGRQEGHLVLRSSSPQLSVGDSGACPPRRIAP